MKKCRAERKVCLAHSTVIISQFAEKRIEGRQPLSESELGTSKNRSEVPTVEPTQPQAVRFASVNEEIEPQQSLQSETTISDDHITTTGTLSAGAQAEIRQLSQGLQNVHMQQSMQQRRMSNFAYEPMSLPTSRVSRWFSTHRMSRKLCPSSHRTFCAVQSLISKALLLFCAGLHLHPKML